MNTAVEKLNEWKEYFSCSGCCKRMQGNYQKQGVATQNLMSVMFFRFVRSLVPQKTHCRVSDTKGERQVNLPHGNLSKVICLRQFTS